MKDAIVQGITGTRARPKLSMGGCAQVMLVVEAFPTRFRNAIIKEAKMEEDPLEDIEEELEDLTDEPEAKEGEESKEGEGDKETKKKQDGEKPADSVPSEGKA